MKIPFTFNYETQPAFRKLKDKSKIPLYPYIPIKLYNGSKKTPLMEGLLDSGSDYTFLPKGVAEFLGLPEIKREEISGIGGSQYSFVSEAGLIIGRGGRETDLGQVRVYIPETTQKIPLLIGRNPLFQEYQVIFEDYKNRVKLIPKEDVLNEGFKKRASKKKNKKNKK